MEDNNIELLNLILFFDGVIMHNMVHLNDGVSVMPAHIKTRVFDVIPHSAILGYLIYNYITCFIIIPIINLLKPQALGHWCVIYFTFSVSRRSSYKRCHARLLLLCSRLNVRVTQPLIVQTCNIFP